MPERRARHEDGIGAVWSEWDSSEHLRRVRGDDRAMPAPLPDPLDRILGEENPTVPEELPPSRSGRIGSREL